MQMYSLKLLKNENLLLFFISFDTNMIYFNFGLLIRQNKLFGVALVARHVLHSHNVISLILARDSLLLFPVRLNNINWQKYPLPPPNPPKSNKNNIQSKFLKMSPWALRKCILHYFTELIDEWGN